METVLLDHPWIPLCLLYVRGWLIAIPCARPRRSPPTRDGPPAGPTATGKTPAEAAE
jgi:hypothetical protein